jgi:hypothetical protein
MNHRRHLVGVLDSKQAAIQRTRSAPGNVSTLAARRRYGMPHRAKNASPAACFARLERTFVVRFLHSRERMSLLTLVFVIVLVGVLLWAVNRFIPMDSKIRAILNAVVVILLVVWLLDVFGILDSISRIRV